MTLILTIDGPPVPQPRPRITTRGKHGHAYTPKTHPVHKYRAAIAASWKSCGTEKMSGPVQVTIICGFVRPPSHFSAKGVRKSAPDLPRPDCDNLAKAVLDALTEAGAWDDDSQVFALSVRKQWSHGIQGYTAIELCSV